MFTKLYDHRHKQFLNIFITLKLNPMPFCSHFHFLQFPSPGKLANLLSASTTSPILHVSYKWDYTMCSLS